MLFFWLPILISDRLPPLQAVLQGQWLIIEDINLAPPDVLASLVPLLDSKELHLSQRAQTIQAASGFQLLATVTSSPGRHSISILCALQTLCCINYQANKYGPSDVRLLALSTHGNRSFLGRL